MNNHNFGLVLACSSESSMNLGIANTILMHLEIRSHCNKCETLSVLTRNLQHLEDAMGHIQFCEEAKQNGRNTIYAMA